jgi:hypothetical protein
MHNLVYIFVRLEGRFERCLFRVSTVFTHSAFKLSDQKMTLLIPLDVPQHRRFELVSCARPVKPLIPRVLVHFVQVLVQGKLRAKQVLQLPAIP